MSIGRQMDKGIVVHVHNKYYSAFLKGHIWVSSNEMDETEVYYTEWSKSEKETTVY